MHPGVEVWGLAQPCHEAEVRSCGVSYVIHYPRRWFGISQIPLALLTKIRNIRFDIISIPHMYSANNQYWNVHLMALLCGGIDYFICGPGCDELRIYTKRQFWRFVLNNLMAIWTRKLDIPLMFASLIIALLKPRRSHHQAGDRIKKRVLHIISSLGVGGAQVQLAELLDHLPRDRYDTSVLVLSSQRDDFSQFRFTRPEVSIHYLQTWPNYSATIWEIARRCREANYDIVHTWLFAANVTGAAGARLAGCPHIISSIRNLSLWKRTWYKKRWYRLADALTARISDEVTVNGTPLVADHASWAWYPAKRIKVIPNGLDPDKILPSSVGARVWLREKLAVAPDCAIIGIVGRLAPEKDQDLFLRVVHRLHADIPDLRAVVVGDGELRTMLQETAQSLGLEGIVHFMGEERESRRIIAGLDLFLLTSRIEGFPNVLLEAAFLGTPSLSTDVGASRDILGDPDSLFEVGDLHAAYIKAKKCLTNLLFSRTLASTVQSNALRRFTAERMASHWLALYERTNVQGVEKSETRSIAVALLPRM
jgi:glycosyltransferase involved in cell wall biosynthesis